ncbi:plant virulence effector HPE1-like domain-containing protein [Affinirhizobium pseudoryzae]|uniref:plant virulence effector HPE1-like domain-containing protein n=1 Tax=Allorhizobium pseudoryzae TaxID=379684 RepID=UPI0013ED2F68|nr:plant virulence effector HPE1-like domain-containing protein [Allorhizobium pseudoryzae]
MYSQLLTILVLAAASPAAASSIEKLSTIPIANPESVVEIRCAACDEIPRTIKEPTYKVPELQGEEQRLELQVRNGKPALLRTEALMGGSPVTFVSLNPVFIENERSAIAGRSGAPMKGDGVDMQATTSAVSSETAADPALPKLLPADAAPPPDFSGLDLRPGH